MVNIAFADGTTVIPAFRNHKTFGTNAFISETIKSGWCLTILSNASPSSMLITSKSERLACRSIFVTVNRDYGLMCAVLITNSFPNLPEPSNIISF
jgi:hypothetical protein